VIVVLLREHYTDRLGRVLRLNVEFMVRHGVLSNTFQTLKKEVLNMKTILSKWTKGPQHASTDNMGRIVYLIAKGIIMLTILMIILFQFTDIRELFALWD
jgi:hypothetical protein